MAGLNAKRSQQWLQGRTIRSMAEATYFAGLRKAGMPEEWATSASLTTLAARIGEAGGLYRYGRAFRVYPLRARATDDAVARLPASPPDRLPVLG